MTIGDLKVLNHHPRVREDGGQGDRLRDATYCQKEELSGGKLVVGGRRSFLVC